MKFVTFSRSLALGFALLLASSAFAAAKGSLQINHPVTVNGTTLKAGDYKVEWEGSGSNVELSIIQGKNVLAKASAHLVELDSPAGNDAVVTLKQDDGTSVLTGLHFRGKKFSLELGESSDGMQAGSSR
jgi:parvulin-like peptidyl-prolyl isomerase